ncbi:MAG: acylneuraminate cytidylyltransferase family protein [Candidatus Micrarchaeia archaeon]|jgi:CMP-N-acetylneuraminic acid synthetase
MPSIPLDKSNEFLCVIPARGGSKGVPRKNVRLLGGIPLIAHSIRSALDSGIFPEVYVSTEDPEIAEVSRKFGAMIIDRPQELAIDKAPMPPVIEHALSWAKAKNGVEPKFVFMLQPTSPFRSKEDFEKCRDALLKGDCDSVMGVFEADDPPQWTLTPDAKGFLKPLFPIKDYLSRRQDLPPAYFDGPIYAFRTDSFLKHKKFLMPKTRFFVVPKSRAVDIDTESDFMLAEHLLKLGALK